MTLPEALSQAQALLRTGQRDQAAALCRGILRQMPEQADTLHLLGLMAQEDGEGEAALDYLRRACAAPGARAAYFSNFAETCRRAALLSEAEQAARRAVALDAQNAGAWNNLGIILQEGGQYAESKACLERSLALMPDNPQAHNNFANTCKRLGLLALAERHWLRALELRDDYPEPHSNLAHLCYDIGAYDRGAYHARRAIAIAPGFVDAYINLGILETARGNDAASLSVLDRALEFAPHNPQVLAAKAVALHRLDRAEEALLLARRAVAAGPGQPEAQLALGQASQAWGDAATAAEAYERAASAPGPVAEKALGSRALLLMELGETEAAQQAFDTALAAYPRSALLHYNRADLKRFDHADDPDIIAMRRLLEASGTARDRTMLHFALGNAYLQLGDTPLAFRHLHAGNRMKRATFSYDATATSRWMGAIAATYTADLLEPLARSDGTTDHGGVFTPVFVVGMPRSGTTLIEQVLASHPAVLGAGETNLLTQAIGRLAVDSSAVARLPPEQLHGMGARYMRTLHRRVERRLVPSMRYVVDKMPANFLHAGLIRATLPGARIIHCRRDPGDTCLSCYSKLFTKEQYFSYDMTELGSFHVAYQRLMAHWRAVLPGSRFIEVDYEDVVADLETQARRILAFLDLPWSDACLAFYRTPRAVRTASVNQVRKPIYATSVGRWRRHATELRPLLEALEQHPIG